jgi:hypothetical protein
VKGNKGDVGNSTDEFRLQQKWGVCIGMILSNEKKLNHR